MENCTIVTLYKCIYVFRKLWLYSLYDKMKTYCNLACLPAYVPSSISSQAHTTTQAGL